tara:strand:- start:2641 stop:2844 length:204 start_codon:yes stop_codon:yes gene_type:complete
MKIGDLVSAIDSGLCANVLPIVQPTWVGLIIDIHPKRGQNFPVVYWNEEYSAEEEYPEQIQLVQERE